MIRTLSLICLLGGLLLAPLSAAAQSRLEKITRTEEREQLQVYCSFSALPKHELERSGRRVDLVCRQTVAAAELTPPPADERIVKTLVRPEGDKLVISLFFRYEPQKIALIPLEQSSRLMLDIVLGNQYTSAFPDLTSQLQGLSVVPQTGRDSTNPLTLSRFQQDWRLLFERQETPLTLHPPPGYTLPPFPLSALGHQGPGDPATSLPPQAKAAAAAGEWDTVLSGLRDALAAKGLHEKARLSLLTDYTEILLRAGRYPEAGRMLDQLREREQDDSGRILLTFLQAQLAARQGDPHLARVETQAIDASAAAQHALGPCLNIFLAELALATGLFDQAAEALARDNVAYTGKALHMRRLRLADLSYRKGEQVKAYAAYMLLGRQGDLLEHPLSLAGYADALYQQHQFSEAALAYQDLSTVLVEDPSRGLALFRLAMSELRRGDQRRARGILEQVLDIAPAGEARSRALLKVTDMDYLAAAAPLKNLALRYGELAGDAVTVPLREEAALKQALIFHQMGSKDKAVELAMRILREFRHGGLRTETQALLIEDLPQVLHDKVQAEEYVDALVLARQNRDLFTRRWLDLSILDDNAEAYLKLGYPERAIKVLQYLLEASPAHQSEQRYSKLIGTLLQEGHYSMAEDYADRYMIRYPQGQELATIFLLRLKALRLSDRLENAAALLRTGERPRDREIDLYGAEIFFQLDQFQETVDLLAPMTLGDAAADQQARFQLAESLFQLRRPEEALRQFEPLFDEERYGDQARYRAGQLQYDLGREDQAVNLWRKLADKGRSPRWQRLATEELQLLDKKIR